MFWNTAKSLFRTGGANYMPVSDLEASATWYKETFGVKPVNIELDDGDDCLALGFSEEECLFVLGPQGKSSGELTARLFTQNLKKARAYLLSHGVQTGETQQDGQSTHFFEMRDLEGNPIEISEEP
jgi:catechol 2,3-dioxygenase-like lactoylglutathione lyase family enzyme